MNRQWSHDMNYRDTGNKVAFTQCWRREKASEVILSPKTRFLKGRTPSPKTRDVPVSTVDNIIKKSAAHETVETLPGQEGKEENQWGVVEGWCELWKRQDAEGWFQPAHWSKKGFRLRRTNLNPSVDRWNQNKVRVRVNTAHKEEEHPTYSWLDDLPWHNVSIEWKIWWFFWNYEEPSEAELEVFLL